MPAPLPRRRSILAAALAGPPVVALSATAARAEDGESIENGGDPAPLPAFTPGEPWLDTSGNVIQAHGGPVVIGEGEQGSLYHRFGQDPSNGYGERSGVHRSSFGHRY